MDDALIAAIVDLLGKPKDGVLDELDEAAVKNPLIADKIMAFSAFLSGLYSVLPGRAVEGFKEVVALIQTGKGPVSHDPVDLA